MGSSNLEKRYSSLAALMVVLLSSLVGCDARIVSSPLQESSEVATLSVRQFRKDDTLWRLAYIDSSRLPDPLVNRKGVASWMAGELGVFQPVVEAASGNQGVVGFTIPIDVRPWRGMVVAVEATLKGEGIDAKTSGAIGAKLSFSYHSPADGKRIYSGNLSLDNDFGWTAVKETLEIRSTAQDGQLTIGLQGCAGRVSYKDVRILAVRIPPQRPPRKTVLRADPGHGFVRLRGVVAGQSALGSFDDLAAWKVNGVRWFVGGGLSDATDSAIYEQWLQTRLDDLDKAMEQAGQHGIKVAICLAEPPGGRIGGRTHRMLVEPVYAARYLDVWERLARRYHQHPALWGFDLLNEPSQEIPSPAGARDWWQIQLEALRRIRTFAPRVPVILEVDGMDAPRFFRWVEAVPDSHVVYEAHMYHPYDFTHQGVYGGYSATSAVGYPGLVDGVPESKATLREALQDLRDFQLAYDVPIYIGEFSAARWSPGADRFLSDCISLFEEYGWDWTYHQFRGASAWDLEVSNLPWGLDIRTRSDTTTDRRRVLDSGWSRNVQAGSP